MKSYLFYNCSLICSLLLLTMCQAESQSSAGKGACQLLSVEAFEKALGEQSNPQLVDVRTLQEFRLGALEGAKNIDFYRNDFLEQMTTQLDRNQPVFVYCKSGGRSGKTCQKLSNSGFTKVYDLKGGYTAWAASRQ